MSPPTEVLEKVGSLPDIFGMDKDALTILVKELYDQSCEVFGEKFDMQFQNRKREVEIQELETETAESHGTFKIPKLKKVDKFKLLEQ